MKDIDELNANVFELFNKDWALLTAGSIGDYNAMTIGWGQLGTLWNKSVVTVFVKPVRYTHGFMEANEYFTVGFYPQEYRRDLMILGSKSGRDGDKVALTHLTPRAVEHGVTFAQAKLTLICKKSTVTTWSWRTSPPTRPKPITPKKRPTRFTSAKSSASSRVK